MSMDRSSYEETRREPYAWELNGEFAKSDNGYFSHCLRGNVPWPKDAVLLYRHPPAVAPARPMPSVREVFLLLVATMEADNGRHFDMTAAQFERAAPSIRALLDAGFFEDDPNDLDGSWWQMAAGEATEAPEFFARCPEAYEVVSGVLNEIFDGVSA